MGVLKDFITQTNTPTERDFFHPLVIDYDPQISKITLYEAFTIFSSPENSFSPEHFIQGQASIIVYRPFYATAITKTLDLYKKEKLIINFLHEFIYSWADEYAYDDKRQNVNEQHSSICSGHAEESCLFRYDNETKVKLSPSFSSFKETGLPVCDMHKSVMLNRLFR